MQKSPDARLPVTVGYPDRFREAVAALRAKIPTLLSPTEREQLQLVRLDLFERPLGSLATIHAVRDHSDHPDALRESNEYFWKMLDTLPTNSEEIARRQEVLDALVDNPSIDVDALIHTVSVTRSFGDALAFLFDIDGDEQDEYESAHEKNDPLMRQLFGVSEPPPEPKPRIQHVIDFLCDFAHGDLELMRTQLAAAEQGCGGVAERHRSSRIVADALRAIDGLSADILAIHSCAYALQQLPHPFFRRWGMEFETVAHQIPVRSVEHFIHLCQQQSAPELDQACNSAGILSDLVSHLKAVLKFARLVIHEKYARVTFDDSQPETYQGAWNFRRKKSGRSSSDPQKNILPQVPNDAPLDRPVTVLTGDIMSGKSFQKEQREWLQRCAQAFGYAPAASANLRIYDTIVSLDRGYTNHENDLSAFGSDVKNFLQVLPQLLKAGRALLLADEWFSTTSPEDQAALLYGVTQYLMQHGVKTLIANHNDRFSDYVGAESSRYGVYHMRNELLSDGTIHVTHRLQSGPNTSHILEIAAKMGLPPDVLTTAQQYLAGHTKPLELPNPQYREPVPYSPEERESLKQVAAGLTTLAPFLTKETIAFRFTETNDIELIFGRPMTLTEQDKKFLSAILRSHRHECVCDHDTGEFWFSCRPAFESGQDALLTSHQSARPTRRRSLFYLQDLYNNDLHTSEIRSDFTPCLLDGGTADTRTLLERQKTYECLMQDPQCMHVLNELAHHLFYAVDFLTPSWHEESDLDIVEKCGPHFNLVLLDEALQAIQREIVEPKFFRHFVGMLRFNLELCRVPPGVIADVAPLLKRLEQVIANLEQFHEAQKTSDQRAQIKAKAGVFAVLGVPSKKSALHWRREHQSWSPFGGVIAQHVSRIDALVRPQLAPLDFVATMREQSPLVWRHFQPIYSLYAWPQETRQTTAIVKSIAAFRSGPLYTDLITSLRSIDSVYLHQYANHLEKLCKLMLGEHIDGADLFKKFAEAYAPNLPKIVETESFGFRTQYRSHFQDFPVKRSQFIKEELTGLIQFVDAVRQMHASGWSKVAFNTTGKIELHAAQNLAAPKNRQVANTFTFNAGQPLAFATGANMSGKSYANLQQLWSVLCAHATGFAPAEYATMPVFDRIFAFDRVKPDSSKNFSAGATEVNAWNELLTQIQQPGIYFGVFDEIWSTVPPDLQSALSYGMTEYLLRHGVHGVIAHHGHDYIDAFLGANPRLASAYYLASTIHPTTGHMRFQHAVIPGHGSSEALAVALTLGMPADIVQRAKIARLTHFPAQSLGTMI